MQLSNALVGSRVILRTLTPEDVTEAYLHWLRDPEVNRFLEVRFNLPVSLEELRSFVRVTQQSSHTLLLAICTVGELVHVGNIKLGPVDMNHLRGDIGFFVGDRAAWGRGLASEAIRLISDYALGDLSLLKVTAGCYASNEGSRRALDRGGFLEEARLARHCVVDGVREDVILFSKMRS